MTFKIIEYVIAVSEEGSFSRAAQRLFISQPALSQSIRKAEIALGAEFFVRDTHAVRLTAAGSALCDHLKQSGSQVGTTLLCGFTEDEKDLLLHFLERVTENIMGSHTLAEP